MTSVKGIITEIIDRAEDVGRIDAEGNVKLTQVARKDLDVLGDKHFPFKHRLGTAEIVRDEAGSIDHIVIVKGEGVVEAAPTKPAKPAAATPRATKASKQAKLVAPAQPEPEVVEPVAQEPEVEQKPADLLMWVGYEHYPTIASFVDEAQRLGISKRIGRIPQHLVLGKTRLFLAHDEGVKGEGVVFGYVVLDRVEVLVRAATSELPLIDIPETVDADRVFTVSLEDASNEDSRGCGKRTQEGAVYVVTSEDRAVDMVWFADGQAIDYKAGVDEAGRRFRSFRHVDGDTILSTPMTAAFPAAEASKPYDFTDRKPKSAWTDEERMSLMSSVKALGPYQGCKEFARLSNRSLQACMFQYRSAKESKD